MDPSALLQIMAAEIAGGMASAHGASDEDIARRSIAIAREIQVQTNQSIRETSTFYGDAPPETMTVAGVGAADR